MRKSRRKEEARAGELSKRKEGCDHHELSWLEMIGKEVRETEKLARVVTIIIREWENLVFWLRV
jgi:hypothetical protein